PVFDTDCRCAKPARCGERDAAAHKAQPCAFQTPGKLDDGRAADLHFVKMIGCQQVVRHDDCTATIERGAEAEAAEGGECLLCFCAMPREGAFRYFQNKKAALEAMFIHDPVERAGQPLVCKIRRAEIDGEGPVLTGPLPLRDGFRCGMCDKPGQLAAAFAPLEEGEEKPRREQTIIRVFPANIGFRTKHFACCQAEFRLAHEEQVLRVKGEVNVPVGQAKGTAVHLFTGRYATASGTRSMSSLGYAPL